MNVIVPKKKTNNQKKEDKGSFILRPPEPLNDFHGQDCRRDGRTVQPGLQPAADDTEKFRSIRRERRSSSIGVI